MVGGQFIAPSVACVGSTSEVKHVLFSCAMANPHPKDAPNPAEPPLIDAATDQGSWDSETDVLVIGFGGAGACAALQAHHEGAKTIVVDRFNGGGATAISGGVVYAGGGTSIQKDADVTDTPGEMFKYLKLETEGIVSEETLRDFCDESIPNLQWLSARGVPFEGSLCPVKTSYPTDDYYLYYSGNEGLAPFRDKAKPAPRGHRAKGSGLPGASFYEPLRKSAHEAGIDIRYNSRVNRLITDDNGRVIGAEYHQVTEGKWRKLHERLHNAGIAIVKYHPATAKKIRQKCFEIENNHSETKRVHARRGVILAAGGFIYNRDMVKKYAPAYRNAMPLGTTADNGSGILLGQSVGGAIDQMARVSAWRFINPPEAFAKGMLVNADGHRYINEYRYGAAVGEAMVEKNNGVGILIINKELRALAREQSKPGKAQWFQRAPALLNIWFNSKKGNTVEALAAATKIPVDNLKATLDAYNDAAEEKNPDAFGKDTKNMQAMRRGPYYAINCSLNSKRFPCPTLTLGGLVVEETSGLVKNGDGETIAGLYAAGRNAVGVCSRQYVSGLSIADCVYSGRRAGTHAAKAVVAEAKPVAGAADSFKSHSVRRG